MLIRVVYDGGRFGVVKPYVLDKLLEHKKVTSFLRSEGWVAVGRDALRSHSSSQGYDEPERRDCNSLSDLLGRELVVTSLQEAAVIAGVIIFISILFSGLL